MSLSAKLRLKAPTKTEKRPSQGRRLGRFGGFAGRTAPANLLLKRGRAASNNKTDIEVSIFPNPRFFNSQKSVAGVISALA